MNKHHRRLRPNYLTRIIEFVRGQYPEATLEYIGGYWRIVCGPPGCKEHETDEEAWREAVTKCKDI